MFYHIHKFTWPEGNTNSPLEKNIVIRRETKQKFRMFTPFSWFILDPPKQCFEAVYYEYYHKEGKGHLELWRNQDLVWTKARCIFAKLSSILAGRRGVNAVWNFLCYFFELPQNDLRFFKQMRVLATDQPGGNRSLGNHIFNIKLNKNFSEKVLVIMY